MSYRIGVDIGGTFTDCVVADDAGHRTLSKALTSHGALYQGVLGAVERNAEERGLDIHQLLGATTQFVHGTTVATNAVLTRRGATIGLLTTRGHEDALLIGKVSAKSAGLAERDLIHASRLDKPVPIVPPERIHGVSERIDVEGEVVAPLDEASAVAGIEALVASGVEAIAVSLLWSFRNPAHEIRIGELLQEKAPGVFATFSHELAPVLGEYERTVTTVLNAYVGPEVSAYLAELESRLRSAGLQFPLLVMQASDGLTSVEDASRRPIVTLDSGPTGGVLGCRYLSELYDEPHMVCTDVGGTSFDVGVIHSGQVPLEAEPVISQYAFRIPKVAVRSIGAGGGSIGWLDDGGILRVGPQSAGSTPGPACYGRGGDQATVTDADLVLGYFDANAFLGGRMKLDRSQSVAALQRLGAPLGMAPEEVAVGMLRIVNAHMADLIRRSTIEQGNDPRDCVLVAYGGAGPTHAAFYGADIGAKSILIPADSTVFSAEGMLTCQMVHSAGASHPMVPPFSENDFAGISARLDELETRTLALFGSEGVRREEVALRRTVTVRYGQQVHTVDVDVPGRSLRLADAAEIKRGFERRYAELFGAGSIYERGAVAYEACRVVGTRDVAPLQFLPAADAPQRTAASQGERQAYFEGSGFVATQVFQGGSLGNGARIEGPAIIERMGDSVVVPPGQVATVDPYMSLRIRGSEDAR